MPCSPVPKTSSLMLLAANDFLIVDTSREGDSGGESVVLGEAIDVAAELSPLMGGSLMFFTVVSPLSPKYLTGETERLEVGLGPLWHIQDCIQREMRCCQDVVDVSSNISVSLMKLSHLILI